MPIPIDIRSRWIAGLARLAAVALWTAAMAAQATGTISMQANARYEDANQASVTLLSNVVTANVDATPPTIAFYMDASYTGRAQSAELGKTLYVGVVAAMCNRQPTVAESMVVDVWSMKTQQHLSVTATESGPDTGVFHFQLVTVPDSADWMSAAAERAQSTGMEAVPASNNDLLQAHIDGCGYGGATARILIDPSGVVFDSASNAPVAGATVTLVDVTGAGNGGQPGHPARVFGDDGTTPVPSVVTTSATGVYTFPVVGPSQYRLDVVAPSAYRFPSTVAAAALPAGRHILLTGSFNGTFPVNEITGNAFVDIPLDEAAHAMSVAMTASRATAEIAESVGYTVVMRNVGATDLDHIAMQDTLPKGFTYLSHSATIDDQAADEPGSHGPSLTFAVPAMPVGQTRTLRYRATIGPLALSGDGVNRAQARATLPTATVSNIAAATVQIQQGVFTDRAMILGKVYADCNGNGVQDDGEVGVPGVRLIMEDGSFVVTDGKGRYSFYGISPRTHVLKIDATTLPPGTAPMAISSRNAGDGASRFVDPQRGELHRADFALSGCSKALDAVIALRANSATELNSALKMDFRADGGAQVVGDVRAQPASGLVGEAQGVDGTHSLTVHSAAVDAAADSPAAVAPTRAATDDTRDSPTESATESATHSVTQPTMAQRIATLDNALGFVDLHDGQTLPAAQATVRVKGPSQVLLALSVDGQPVGDERIGTRVRDDEHQVQARDYVGVPLTPGTHELGLVARDPFGNVRGSARIRVRAPGNLARITLGVPSTRLEADGATMVPITVDLVDAQGVPVGARTAVTLDASLGEWDLPDFDRREPGVQTFIEGGHAEFRLRAPRAAGSADLRVTSGAVTAKGRVSFEPALRPMIAAGIVEGALNLHRLGAGQVSPANASDGFEAQLNDFAANGDRSANGRAALYLKGKVLGSSLLTLGYDSAKESNETLFRDIQPDRFYPVYGDSSTKGFDAQSTSHLYVRLEHDKSYILYGDFTTQANDPVRQLGAYQRSLTGAKAHVEEGPVAATAFASRATSRQIVDEIRANGTSGPFSLTSSQALANSEKVEILVRDRNQPSLIIRDNELVRFTDYDIDSLTGRLLLHAPVPSVDPDLNPESIRVSYEADSGGASFIVAGVDAKAKIGDRVEVGIALVMDKDPLDTMHMGSVDATFRPDEQTSVTVEAARTEHDLTGNGNAQRVELKHDDGRLKVQARAAHTDANFDNPSAMISKGRNEAEVNASYAAGEKTRVVLDAVSSGDVVSGDRRSGVLLGVERSLGGNAKLEVGARHVKDVPGTAGSALGTPDGVSATTTTTTTLRAKYSTPVPGVEKATVFVEGEQDVHQADKRLLAVGGDYRLTPTSRLYVREEAISSLTGEIALDASQRRNTTLVGVDSDLTHDTHLFSEYRVRDAIDGREAEAAMGLRNRWTLAEGLRLNTSFERVHTLSGPADDSDVAATAAIEYTRDPLTKATARLELRDGSSSRGVLSTLGLAHKIDDDWTLLGRNAYALTESKTGSSAQLQERFQLGVAYRDTRTNRINGLARYEFKREDGGTDFSRRGVHILSGHADLQAARDTMLTGEYAYKHDAERVGDRWVIGDAQLLGLRTTHDLDARWDVGLAWRVLASGNLSSRVTNLGAELGYRVVENLWVSLGYNVTGFRDRDLVEDNTSQLGAYMRVRFKFDESLFGAKLDTSAKKADR